MLFAGPGVATGFSMAAGAQHRDPEWNQAVAQFRRFPRREHEAYVWEHQPKRTDKLHQFALADLRERLEFARARP